MGMAFHCSKCGTALPGGSQFCAACGSRVSPPEQSAPALLQNSGWAPSPTGGAWPAPPASSAWGQPQGTVGWGQPVAGGSTGYGAAQEIKYAGFWVRFAAQFVDGLVLIIPNFLLSQIYQVIVSQQANLGQPLPAVIVTLQTGATQFLLQWIYCAVMESGPWQATVGKRALGVVVVDYAGNRISFGRASGRFFGKLLSAIILGIGYFMAGWTARKQALHDSMAGTLVIKKPSSLARASG